MEAISPTGYAILGGSVAAAVVLDYLIVRLSLEFLRPPSMYVFLAGRAGKLIALIAWTQFFNRWWYPEFTRQALPSMVTSAEIGVVAALALLAAGTLPRPSKAERRAVG